MSWSKKDDIRTCDYCGEGSNYTEVINDQKENMYLIMCRKCLDALNIKSEKQTEKKGKQMKKKQEKWRKERDKLLQE